LVAEVEYGIEPLLNGVAIPWPWSGLGRGFRLAQKIIGFDPSWIAVVQQAYPQALLAAVLQVVHGLGS
jgi:hypothetical protein